MNSWKPVFQSRGGKKIERGREKAQTEAEKIYIHSRWYHVFIGSRLVREPSSDFTTDSRAPRLGLTQSGKRERRCEAGIRIPPKTVPLSFQRLEEYVATSSCLPPPSSFPRERNLWKGWRRRRSESTKAIHVVVVRFARNDNAWMALIRRIENRVWLYGVWRRKGRVSMVMEVD